MSRYELPEEVPAWRVEVYTYSTIVGHLIGRQRAAKYDRTFRTRAGAEAYASTRKGLMSLLVPFMFWQSEVVPTTRLPDWRDRLRAFINQRPIWKEGRA